MIEFKNVSAGYKTQNFVIENLNIKFKKKGFYGILGPNGAGKSTILKTILGYLPTSSGEIYIDGKLLKDYDKKELAKKISYVPQFFNLQFDYKVKEVILMGRFPYQKKWLNTTKEDLAKVSDVLKTLDLEGLSEKHYSELSGGEQQRVSIARALVQETEVILLDESFSHLDINHQLDIVKILKKMNSLGKLIILVSHNINFASEYCKEIVFLKNGKLIDIDVPEKILTEDNFYKLYNKKIHIQRNSISGKPNIFYLEKNDE